MKNVKKLGLLLCAVIICGVYAPKISAMNLKDYFNSLLRDIKITSVVGDRIGKSVQLSFDKESLNLEGGHVTKCLRDMRSWLPEKDNDYLGDFLRLTLLPEGVE